MDPPAVEELPAYTCFVEEESKVVYIDFEQVFHVIQEVVVKGKDGEILYAEDVSEVAVDAIFELDLSDHKANEFTVELHSPATILQSEVAFK
jgi:hypothetical protein